MDFCQDTFMRKFMLNFKSNSIEVSKLNIKCQCEYCKNEIIKGSYHLIFNLHFRYYGFMSKEFNEKKKKKVIGTIRMHFDCFSAMLKELNQLDTELEQFKVDLFTKQLMK